MAKYRYRTNVLTGPWRETPDQAMNDAVRARQIRMEEPGQPIWIVPGWIEDEDRTLRSAG